MEDAIRSGTDVIFEVSASHMRFMIPSAAAPCRAKTKISLVSFSFSSLFPPADDITHRSGPVRLAGLHQPPGAEDLPVQPAPRALRLPSARPGRLGDPQGPERQALLLQPRHRGAHLEAAPHPGHERQHQQQQHQGGQPGHGGERGEGPAGNL